MPSSLTKIWIHAFFSTKNRMAIIESTYESRLHSHIKQHLENDFHCLLQTINGTADHLHLLFLLNPNYAIKDILKNVKGESSHWVNSNDFILSKFAWQKAYTAISVGDSMVKDMERFIEAQKEYHRTLTYLEEQQRMIALHRMQFRLVTN
jgi:putative transposase